jgi:hypothetical protein
MKVAGGPRTSDEKRIRKEFLNALSDFVLKSTLLILWILSLLVHETKKLLLIGLRIQQVQ